MSGIIDTTLPQLANQVRTATAANENDRERVGSLFEGIIDYIAQNEAAWLQDTGGGGGGSLSEPGALLKKLWLKGNPEAERILKYDGSDWVPIPVPSGGGSGGGMDVAAMWAALQNTTGDYANYKIPASHLDLSGCLSTATKFWGENTVRTEGNNKIVDGNLSGNIDYIQFSNGIRIGVYYAQGASTSDTLRIYDANGGTANIFADGGVSALGNSSSGSGGGGGEGGTRLNSPILQNINGDSANPGTLSAGNVVYYNGNGHWIYKTPNLGDLGNVTLNASGNPLSSGQALIYNGSNWVNGTISSGGGAQTLNELDGVANTFNNISSGQVLTYSNGEWKNADLPIAGNSTVGVISVPATNTSGLSLDTSTGVLKHNTYTAKTSGLYKITVDGFGHVSATDAVSVSDLPSGITGLWPATKNFTISEHNGTSAYGNLDGGRASTTSTNGSNSIEIFLKQCLPNTITGGATAIKAYDSQQQEYVGVYRYVWGKEYCGNGLLKDVQGNLTAKDTNNANAFLLNVESNAGNPVISMLNRNIIDYDNRTNQDTLSIGFGATGNYLAKTQIMGKNIELRTSNSNVYLPAATDAAKGLRIGDAILYWDDTNQALALTKVSTDAHPGTVGNFYATGGVSALGFSNGTSSIDAMTFNNLTVNEQLNIADILMVGNAQIYSSGEDILMDLEGNKLMLSGSLYMGSDSIEFGDYNTPDTLKVVNHHLYFNDAQIV